MRADQAARNSHNSVQAIGIETHATPHFLQTVAGEPRPKGVGGAAPRGGASRRPTEGREDGGDGTSPADCEAITIVGAGQPAVPPTSGTPKAGSTGLGRTFSGVRGLPRPIAPQAHKPAERTSARAPVGLARTALRRDHTARFLKSFFLKSVFRRLEPAPNKALRGLNGGNSGRYPQLNGGNSGLMGEIPGAIHRWGIE